MLKENLLNSISNLLNNLKFNFKNSFNLFKNSSFYYTLIKYFDFNIKKINNFSIDKESLAEKSLTFKKFKSSFEIEDKYEEPVGIYLKKGSRFFSFLNFNKIPKEQNTNLTINLNSNSDFKPPYQTPSSSYILLTHPLFKGIIPKDSLNYYYNSSTNVFLRMSTLKFRMGMLFFSPLSFEDFCSSATLYLWIYIKGFTENPYNFNETSLMGALKISTFYLGLTGPLETNLILTSNHYTWRRGLDLKSKKHFIELTGELDLNPLLEKIWGNSFLNYSKEDLIKDFTLEIPNKNFGFFLNGDLNNGIDIKSDSNYYLGGNGMGDKEVNENFYFYSNTIPSRVLRKFSKLNYSFERDFFYNPEIEIYLGMNFLNPNSNMNISSSFYNGFFSLTDKKYPSEIVNNYGWIKTLYLHSKN